MVTNQTTVYLVRHGESEGNTHGFFQGCTDCKLSETGLLQLEVLKERFKTITYDKIYSSPLTRTHETAMAVNFYHKLPIELDDGLIEINGGIFEGKSFDEIDEEYPTEYNVFCNELHLFAPENGESIVEVYNRMLNTVERLVKRNAGKTIVLVSHGCAIKNYLCHATSTPIEKIGDMPWSDNTGVSKINFDENFVPTVEYMNDFSHLDKLAIKTNEVYYTPHHR